LGEAILRCRWQRKQDALDKKVEGLERSFFCYAHPSHKNKKGHNFLKAWEKRLGWEFLFFNKS